MSTTPTPVPDSANPKIMDEDQLQQGIWILWDFKPLLGKYGVDSALEWYPPPPPHSFTRKLTSQDVLIFCRAISHIAKTFKVEEKAKKICSEIRAQVAWMFQDEPTCECMTQEPPQSQDPGQSKETVFKRKKEFTLALFSFF